ncbi:hypothetical protein OV450_6388 [Actinobacteria bacterium OV450]|nr:hypothetical protein OV450_6388 [Actinobacteria bacterium OV450]
MPQPPVASTSRVAWWTATKPRGRSGENSARRPRYFGRGGGPAPHRAAAAVTADASNPVALKAPTAAGRPEPTAIAWG